MSRLLCLAAAALVGVYPYVGFSSSFEGAFAFEDVTYDVTLSDVPEPSTLLIFGSSLVGLAALARSRKRRSRAAD